MIQSNDSSKCILTVVLLTLGLAVEPVFAESRVAETNAQVESASAERHRHGPPGKGFYRT